MDTENKDVNVDMPCSSNEDCKPKPTTKKSPTCLIVLGMAGSGKTTFVQVKFSNFEKVLMF